MRREDWAELVQHAGSDLYKDRRAMWQTSPRLQMTTQPGVWVLVPALETTQNGTRSPIHVINAEEAFLKALADYPPDKDTGDLILWHQRESPAVASGAPLNG
jgi:hypothetical protein